MGAKMLVAWIALTVGGPVLAADPSEHEHLLSCDFVTLESGLLVTRCDSYPVHVFGPPMPGELNVMGTCTPGLLDPAEVRMLSRRLPDTPGLPKQKPPGVRSPDRLLVVIDAGHGGSQLGAVGVSGVREKDVVLAVAEQTRRVLSGTEGLEVVMTRLKDEEISLWDRVDAANQLGASVFVSIHANAFTSPHLGGVETFFHSVDASDEEAKRVASAENAPGGKQQGAATDALSYILQDMHGAEKLRDSSRLAHLVQEQLARVLPFENRGVMQADFIVLRDTRMPSVLIELGFLTNPREEKVLTKPEVHKKVASAIRRGVLRYWELVRRKRVHSVRGKKVGR